MSSEIRIRLAAPGDEAALASLGADVHALHVAQRPDVFEPIDGEGFELNTGAFNERARTWFEHLGFVGKNVRLEIKETRHGRRP